MTGPNGLKCDNGGEYLFSGSRDGTVKRWELGVDGAVCGATFESHVDWVFTHTITLRICNYQFPYEGYLKKCIFIAM